jgi:DNA adenine methylase
MNAKPAGPFLKWAGGKGKLAPAVVARAPAVFGRYHEPFVGGGAVFFALRGARPGVPARLADANADLMNCFTALRDDCDRVIVALTPLATAYAARDAAARANLYYEIRAMEPADRAERAARAIFLNRTCYNGLYRVNSRGHFNVPHGRYTNPRILDADGLRAASAALAGIELACEDFEAACAQAAPGDFVYLDPPYQPLSATANFTSYTKDSFGPAEQARLRDAFDDLTRRGVGALLSNSDHPSVHALYGGRGYTFEVVSMSRAINSNGAGRAPVPELLISNLEWRAVQLAFAALS